MCGNPPPDPYAWPGLTKSSDIRRHMALWIPSDVPTGSYISIIFWNKCHTFIDVANLCLWSCTVGTKCKCNASYTYTMLNNIFCVLKRCLFFPFAVCPTTATQHFQSEFSTDCNLVLPLSIYGIIAFPQCHLVAGYVLFRVFPSLIFIHNSLIHLAICPTTRPKLLPKRALHIARSRASSSICEYPLLSLRSSSSCLHLLPRLPVTSIIPFTFPSITCRRRQFLRKMWPIQLAFRLLIVYI
jgi:hypothetical protein